MIFLCATLFIVLSSLSPASVISLRHASLVWPPSSSFPWYIHDYGLAFFSLCAPLSSSSLANDTVDGGFVLAVDSVLDLTIGFRNDCAPAHLMSVICGRTCKADIYVRFVQDMHHFNNALYAYPCQTLFNLVEKLVNQYQRTDK